MQSARQKVYNLLRWSEQYTQTDMVYLARGGFWLTLGQVVATGFGLILTIGFANLLSKESYGTYKFVLSIAGIIGAFSLTGLSASITRSVAQGYENVVRSGFATSLKWSFLVFVSGLLGFLYYLLNDNSTLAFSMLIAGSFSPIIASSSIYGAYLEGKKDFRRLAVYGIFRNITPIISLLTTITLTNNPVVVILIYFLSNALASLLIYRKTISKTKPNNLDNQETVPYAKHLSLMNIISVIAHNIDKVIVFHFLGAVPLAVYSFAIAPVDQIQAIKKFLKILAIPKLSTKTKKEIQESISSKSLKIFFLSILVISLYIILIPVVYKIIFPQYLESIIYSQIYSLILLFTPIVLYTESLTAQKNTKELYIIRTISPTIKIILMILLVPIYGLYGLVVGILLSKFISSLTTVILFYKSN